MGTSVAGGRIRLDLKFIKTMYTNTVTRREKLAMQEGFISNVTKMFKVNKIQESFIDLYKGFPRIRTRAVEPLKFIMNVAEYSKFIGTTFFRVGSQPIKFRMFNLSFIQFVKHTYDKINKDILDIIIKELINFRVVTEGNYLSNQKSFKNMAEGNSRTNSVKAESMLEELSQIDFYGLNLKLIDFDITSDLLDFVKLNKQSYPGLITSNYFGLTRDKTLQATLECTKRLFDFICENPVKYCGLYKILGREKDIKCTDEGVTKGTRPVLAPEEALTLIGGLFSQIITLSIRQDKENNIFIGKTLSKNSYLGYFKQAADYYYSLSIDWNTFDQFVDEESIIAACAIFRSMFPEEKKYDRLFYFLATSLIHKNIVFPPGVIYECTNGLPSGHPFTSILGSLINYIHCSRALLRTYKSHKDKYGNFNWLSQFMGDDSRHLLKKIKYLHETLFFNLSNCSSLVITQEDFSLNPVISSIADFNDKFLKRCVSYDQLIYWERQSIIRKLIYPSKPKTFYYDLRQWILNWVDTAPGDIVLNKMLEHYLEYISKVLPTKYYNDGMKNFIQVMSSHLFERVTLRSFQRIYNDMKTHIEDSTTRVNMHQAFSIPLIKKHIISNDVQALIFTSLLDGRQYVKHRNVINLINKLVQEALEYKMPNAPNI